MKTEAILISSFIIIFLVTGFYISPRKSPAIPAHVRVPEDHPTIQDALNALNPETFNITVYANEIEIQTQTLTQPSWTSITVTFVWETSNIDKGTYIIKAYATPVQGEIDTTDNTFTDRIVLIDTVIGGVTIPDQATH